MSVRLILLLAAIVLTLAGPLSTSLPGQAADQANQLNPQERQELEDRALELLKPACGPISKVTS